MVLITRNNWNKIMNYAQAAYQTFKAEIGGMAVCLEDKDGDWSIEDPIILKQDVSSGNCVLDKIELAKYYTKVAASKKYKNANYRFLWWHSHHKMAAFWSGTDLSTIEESNEGDFNFSLVVNLKGDYKLRVSIWNPAEIHDDIDLHIMGDEIKCPKSIIKEVKKKCNEPIVNNTLMTNRYGTYGYNQPSLFSYQSHNKAVQNNVFSTKDDKFSEIFEKTYTFVDDITDDLSQGAMQYPEFAKKMKVFDERLKKEDLGIRLSIPTENNYQDVFYKRPEDYMDIAKDKIGIANQCLEMTHYNNWEV